MGCERLAAALEPRTRAGRAQRLHASLRALREGTLTRILDIESILSGDRASSPGETIGHSREGRAISAYRFGAGDLAVSLIGGCHADEPVGPAMLSLLAGHLERQAPASPLLERYRWRIVPHVNPDGDLRNRAWSDVTVECRDHRGHPDRGYEIASYLAHVVRELPGDDIEFGFPRSATDLEARPENLAVADFLRPDGPYLFHGSFHGMDVAVGPWFLMEAAWIERTAEMRSRLRALVRDLGYSLMDIDRGGEKGFVRIDEGFTTRPDSAAMTEHFERLDDLETAARFRPSSMEFVRSLGGDPLTIVSEMPHFLSGASERPAAALKELLRVKGADAVSREVERTGLRPMPLRDQMRLQLAFLDEGLAAAQT